MLNEREIKTIKRAIANADFTTAENIEIFADNKKIIMTIDGIQEDVYTDKNDFLNMIIDGLKVGATDTDKEHIKELEKMKNRDMNIIIDTYINDSDETKNIYYRR